MKLYLSAMLRYMGLVCVILLLAPFLATLVLFSIVLKKDEAHFSH